MAKSYEPYETIAIRSWSLEQCLRNPSTTTHGAAVSRLATTAGGEEAVLPCHPPSYAVPGRLYRRAVACSASPVRAARAPVSMSSEGPLR